MRPAALLFASGAFSSLLFALFGDLLRSDVTPLVQDLCPFMFTGDHWQLDLRSLCIGVAVGILAGPFIEVFCWCNTLGFMWCESLSLLKHGGLLPES